MDNRPVIFHDSGIGCLPYALFFHSRNPGEDLICVADRENFPYGQKTKEYLVDALTSLTEKFISLYNPKIYAIVCNSAAVSALPALRERFPGLPIVGTVPAIKPAAEASKTRCIGVLGTQRTISDHYIEELRIKFAPDTTIVGIAAPELPEFIEHRWLDADEAERLDTVKPYIAEIISKGADTLVLACTHFVLLKDEFRCAAALHGSKENELMIFDSVEGISRRVEFLLDENDSRLRSSSGGGKQVPLKITGDGEPDTAWKNIAAHFGVAAEKL